MIEEYKPIEWILNIRIFNTGIKLPSWLFAEWGTKFCHDLAALDYISPSTGEALRDVLVGMNGKIPEEGIEAQVIRWKV